MKEILKFNMQRYENQSYYYLRVALVYLCVEAALAVNYELPYAVAVIVLTGLVLVVGYGGNGYEWTEYSDTGWLNDKVVKLRIRRMRRIRLILISSTLLALTIDLIINLLDSC